MAIINKIELISEKELEVVLSSPIGSTITSVKSLNQHTHKNKDYLTHSTTNSQNETYLFSPEDLGVKDFNSFILFYVTSVNTTTSEETSTPTGLFINLTGITECLLKKTIETPIKNCEEDLDDECTSGDCMPVSLCVLASYHSALIQTIDLGLLEEATYIFNAMKSYCEDYCNCDCEENLIEGSLIGYQTINNTTVEI